MEYLRHKQLLRSCFRCRMGIDRKDVRVVCHFNIPKSMEGFYQESGRAGRDQLPSRSVLYYGVDDRRKMEFILSNTKRKKDESSSLQDKSSKKSLDDFKQMVEYCEGSGCRRKMILENFGEMVPDSLCEKSCDVCKHPNLVTSNLEQLKTATAFRQRTGSSRIYMTRLCTASFVSCYVFYTIFFFFVVGFAALEQRVFRKQSLYLHEVVVRLAYTIPSSDLTCGISLVVQVSMPENNCQNFGTVMMKQVDQKKIYLNLMVCTLIIVVVGSHALKPLGSFDVMLFAFIDFHSWLSRNYLYLDALDAAKNAASSKTSAKLRLQDKMDLLQRAEENYYQNKSHDKQVNKLDKNVIPETLREAGKQRLLNAIKQNQQMVNDSRIDIDKSVVFLENECYKKYGKSGKSFYLSQMASTARWLSTAGPMELVNKLSSSSTAPPPENVTSIADCTPASSNLSVPISAKANHEEVHDNAGPQDPIRSPASPIHGSASAKLPPILSFSQFINSGKAKENLASASKRQSPDRGKNKLEKRMRFQ
ncbi:hypothetical protein MTR67_031813 [Solanum verrucosum]|uniref:DNA 3'-5' helicase n=1 Tax=Solanum verrucosum TaxID=315347 RepID=A0AAF0U377_SOLVR|nr:hypothetical protein MTR67_031813 [Solanum verrucosum]